MRDSAWFMSSRTRATRETENLGSTSILLVPTGEHGRPAALCGSLEHGPAACAPSGFLTRCLGNASGIVSGVKLRWAQDWKVCVPCSRERRLPACIRRQLAGEICVRQAAEHRRQAACASRKGSTGKMPVRPPAKTGRNRGLAGARPSKCFGA